MKSHVVIPVFVTHMGCPFECIFCDQRKISGQKDEMTAEKMRIEIEKSLPTIREGTHVEIGFYGGSFTGIPEKQQFELLETANSYLTEGKVQGIRLSTRPDFIDKHIIEYLQSYNVGLIELGIQSLDDDVLEKTRRGYTSADAIRAMEMISSSGIRLGAQTMIGLPEDTVDKDISTAQVITGFSPEVVRIYPTLVVKGTLLEKMYREGRYNPLSLDEAVDISSKLLEIYTFHNIKVIRIGLQPTEELNDNCEVAGGPFHPAFRHLVESKLMLKKIIRLLDNSARIEGKILNIYSPQNNLSDISGYKRENIKFLKETFGFKNILIKYDSSIDKLKVVF